MSLFYFFKISHVRDRVLVFLCLTYFTRHNTYRSNHVVANGKTSFFLKAEYSTTHAHNIFSSSIHLLMDIYVASISWLLKVILLWPLGCILSFQISVSNFFGYIPRSRIVGSQGSSTFSFVEEPPCCFHSNCINLHFHQQRTRVPLSPHPHQHLLFVDFQWQPFWHGWSSIFLWFWLAFPWWLVILITFSHACWSSEVFFGKNGYSGLLTYLPITLLIWYFDRKLQDGRTEVHELTLSYKRHQNHN